MFLVELAEPVGFRNFNWSMQGSNPAALASPFLKDSSKTKKKNTLYKNKQGTNLGL